VKRSLNHVLNIVLLRCAKCISSFLLVYSINITPPRLPWF